MKKQGTQRMEQPEEEPASAEEALAPDLAGLRQKRIAERAYGHAEKRGFEGAHDLDDWLQAEREIDEEKARRP
jgi:hypothetical protein